MAVLSSSCITKHPASLANPSGPKLPTRSLHSQKSSSSFGGLSCITVRRDDLKTRAGIRLAQDSKTGEITVSSISEKGVFHDTALEIGDVVLSVNKQRLKKGEGPEILMDIVRTNKTISIAIKKPSKSTKFKEGTPLSSSSRKKPKNKSKHGSSSHHRKKRSSKRETPSRSSSDNTVATADSSLCYGGLTQQNAGAPPKAEPTTKTLTISACKPGSPIEVAGKSARRLSASKSQHNRTSISRRMSDSSHGSSHNTTSSKHRRKLKRTSDSSHGSTGSVSIVNVAGKSSRRLSLSRSQHSSRRMSGSSHGSSHKSTGSSGKLQRKKRTSSRASKTTHNRTSISNKNQQASVGLKLRVTNKQLEVVEIRDDSIFKGTQLRTGDKILSINDMSFRIYADAEYAFTIMDNARLLVTLVIERLVDGEDHDDSTTLEDDSSISSFGNDDVSSSFQTEVEWNNSNSNTNSNTPFTITVAKAFKRQNAGLSFKTTHRSSKKDTKVYVDKIDRDSIFRKTPLKKGDRVLMINNTDLRSNPDTELAYNACMESNESIAMVVLRKESDSSNKETAVSCGDWNIEL